MSTGTKWLIGIVVVIVLAVLAWHFLMGTTPQPQPVQPTTQTQPVATTTAPQANTSGLPTPQSDVSDTAIAQDTTAVDLQMQGLTTDANATSQSMHDQSIKQAY